MADSEAVPAVPDPPTANNLDGVLVVAKAAAGAIPILGSTVQEILEAVLGRPFARRQAVWMNQVADLLNHVARLAGRTAEELGNDETFVSAVALASRAAMGTHLEEKLEMFKAVLLHHLLDPSRGDAITLRFVRWVDELDPEHVHVALYCSNPRQWWEDHHNLDIGRFDSEPGGAAGPFWTRRLAIEEAGLGIDEVHLDLVISELETRRIIVPDHLIRNPGAGDLLPLNSADNVLTPAITPIGDEWLRWISAV